MIATLARYEYEATLLRVLDGDTVEVIIHQAADVGLDMTLMSDVRRKLRLFGINAPEMPTAAGIRSRDWLEAQLPHIRYGVLLQTVKDRTEKYGRYLGKLWVAGEDPLKAESVNDRAVRLGYAVAYMT